jgi:hypothetical protein
MATVLDKPLKRELNIDGQPYMLTITPDGVKITPKGRRLGREMAWRDLLSGDAELASQLLRSVSKPPSKPHAKDEAAAERIPTARASTPRGGGAKARR